MNMNKKIIILFFIFFSFFLFTSNINAATTTTAINCNNLKTEDDCYVYGKCRWISGSCQAQFVAEKPCEDNNIKTVLKIAGYILLIAKLVVPLLIIGFGIMDLYKAVIDKDEKSLPKQFKQFLIRLITGIIIFFIPSIVNTIFKLSDSLNIVETDDYKTCASCVLEPLNESGCSTTDVFPNAGIE